MEMHVCTNDRGDPPAGCICAIGKDHDEQEFEAWEENGWKDPTNG